MPTERLLSMIVKNQAEQLELSKQKSRLGTDDDEWMGEDPEMIDAKM
jgi:bloom syndrome protein